MAGAELKERLAWLLARRDDAGAWGVVRDELLEAGDVRGELMALDQQLEATPAGAERQRLVTRRSSLFGSARELLLGRDALLADLQLTWRQGFVAAASVPNAGVHDDCLRELAVHPSGALLEALECSPAQLVVYLEAGPAPVRDLTLREASVQDSRVDFIGGQGVRGARGLLEEPLVWFVGRRGPLTTRQAVACDEALPALRRLCLMAPVEVALRELSSASLEVLELRRTQWVATEWDVGGVLDRCPRLATLRLEREVSHQALRCEAPHRLARVELDGWSDVATRALAQPHLVVDVLDLTSLELDDALARRLALALARLPNVKKVKLPGTRQLQPPRAAALREAAQRPGK